MNPSAQHMKTAPLTVGLALSFALYFALYFIFANRDITINGTSLSTPI